MKNKTNEPIECQACHKNIEIGQTLVNHHITYYPEKIVIVHSRCHGLIHKSKSQYPDLKPDPRQVLRWYTKKGGFVNHYEYANEWYIRMFFDVIENGFWTEERRNKVRLKQLERYWDEVDRFMKIQKKLNIKVDWDSSQIIN